MLVVEKVSVIDESTLNYIMILEVIKMTAEKTTLNIKIDKSVEERAAKLLESMGLDHSTAIDMYYRQIITEQRLPFQSSVAQTYGNQLLDLIKRKGIPNITLPADENGNAYIDKEKHPKLYDWAVNG
jgi:DNA-damage-inducible protein J